MKYLQPIIKELESMGLIEIISVRDSIRIQEIGVELWQMTANDKRSPEDENRSPFLESNRDRVRELGEELNSIGGFYLMQSVADAMPLHDVRELEVAWHGIGDWFA